MIVRAIDGDNDWLFGKGFNDYKRNINAVEQDIGTRLRSFLGNCFFDLGAGLDWFNLLGSKNQTTLTLNISSVILNTAGVTGLKQIFINLDVARKLTVQYTVQSIYSTFTSAFQFDLNAVG